MRKANENGRTQAGSQKRKRSSRPASPAKDWKRLCHKIARGIDETADIALMAFAQFYLTPQGRALATEFRRAGQSLAREIRQTRYTQHTPGKKEA